MDLRWSPAEEAFRDEARGWLEANVPRGLPSGDTRAGFAAHLEWERALHAARWAVVSWPREYGGRDATLWEWLIFEEEYYRAGAPQRVTQNGIFLLAPTLFEFGTPRAAGPQPAADGRRAGSVVPGLVRTGRRAATWRPCAAARSATTAGGGWRLSGQKTWTTRGRILHAPVRPVPHRSARRAAPRADLLPGPARRAGRDRPRLRRGSTATRGSPTCSSTRCSSPTATCSAGSNQGWRVAMATDRVRARPDAALARALHCAPRTGCSTCTGRRAPSAALRDQVVQSLDRGPGLPAVHAAAGHAPSSTASRAAPESSLEQAVLVRARRPAARDRDGPARRRKRKLDGPWSRGFLFSLAGPIYAGTNEIQRNIVAERLLGLPKGAEVTCASS